MSKCSKLLLGKTGLLMRWPFDTSLHQRMPQANTDLCLMIPPLSIKEATPDNSADVHMCLMGGNFLVMFRLPELQFCQEKVEEKGRGWKAGEREGRRGEEGRQEEREGGLAISKETGSRLLRVLSDRIFLPDYQRLAHRPRGSSLPQLLRWVAMRRYLVAASLGPHLCPD